MNLPAYWIGRCELVTPLFGLFWGRDNYNCMDFHVCLGWRRDPEPKLGFRIFKRGIEFGWDWKPRLVWHDNWVDDNPPRKIGLVSWTPRRRSLRGAFWPRYLLTW